MHRAGCQIDQPAVRQTITPLKLTSTRSGSKAASVVPRAANALPQLGSRPKIAHLNRLLAVIERATSSASVSDSAPTTSTAMSWAAPSASVSSC